ncbi:MAG: hypothetical protein JW720_07945 [Sedimentisphaerales bacterium]|nr:hypothetical protein [Sedimentisphaerales bacterium]
MGYWRLDDGSGAETAVDSGPLGYDGSYEQSPGLDAAGVSGTGMDSGGGYMRVDLGADLPLAADARTVSIFIKPSGSYNQKFFGYGETPPGAAFEFTAEEYDGEMGVRFRHWGGNYHFGGIELDEWNHVGIRVPEGAALVGDVEVFIDGVEAAGVLSGGSNIPLVSEYSALHVGTAAVGGETGVLFEGIIDEVQFYDEALSDEQIAFLCNHPGEIIAQLPQAVGPDPANGAVRVGPEVRLSWDTAYADAFTPLYNVYFGGDATEPNLVSFCEAESFFDVPGEVAEGTMYYWRVDVVRLGGREALVYPGRLWSFLSWYDTLNVVRWKLDTFREAEEVFYTNDDSGYGNDGRLYGFGEAALSGPVGGVDGNCVEFSGVGEYVFNEDAAGLPLGENDEWTMNLYVQLDERAREWTSITRLGDDQRRELIVGRGREFAFLYEGRYLLRSGFGAGVGVWHMVTVTRDANGVTMFVDGCEAASMEAPFSSAGAIGDRVNLLLYAGREGFAGKIDEFTVWDGVLSAAQIEALAEELPMRGDLDSSGEVSAVELVELGTAWHDDARVEFGEFILDDAEDYGEVGDPCFAAFWQGFQGEPGSNLVSLVTDAGQCHGGQQAVRWDYDFGLGRFTGFDYRLKDGAVDLSRYDQLHLWMFKVGGSDGGQLWCEFVELGADGRTIGMGQKRCPGGIGGLAEDEWIEWVIELREIHSWESESSVVPYDRITELAGLSIGSYSESGGVGTILFDDLRLVGNQGRCVRANLVRADSNGDCVVDMLDLEGVARDWLSGIE